MPQQSSFVFIGHTNRKDETFAPIHGADAPPPKHANNVLKKPLILQSIVWLTPTKDSNILMQITKQ